MCENGGKLKKEFEGSNNAQEKDFFLFIPIPDLQLNDFRDASKNYDGLSAKEASDEQTAPSEKKKRGKKVKLNGKELAVFFYKESAYAIDEKCPHLGGPLHLGDIEDIGCGELPRIRCPWHHWCFEMKTGRQVRPHYNGKSVNVYPSRITEKGEIEIGFSSFDPKVFSEENF